MSPQYELVHTTAYSYDAEVTTSYGRAHLAPLEQVAQQVSGRELATSPPAAEVTEHTDYFGNVSTFFLIVCPHTELAVTARSNVTVTRTAPESAALSAISLAQARAAGAADPAPAEFLLPSPRIGRSAELDRYSESIFGEQESFGSALRVLIDRIHTDFRYRSGATTVLSDISELLRTRAGVCQDFAHLAVGCLRSAGLAARYVSGYLETIPAPGTTKLQGVDASHAWVSVYAPGLGWIDLDPTNNQVVDDRYVVTATGRDYADVPPLKGVIFSNATQSTLTVSVDVTRVA